MIVIIRFARAWKYKTYQNNVLGAFNSFKKRYHFQ